MPQAPDPRLVALLANRARVARQNLIANIDACFLAHSRGDEQALHWVAVNFPRLLDHFRSSNRMADVQNNLQLLSRCRTEPELRALFRNYLVNHYDITLGTQFQPPPEPNPGDHASILAYVTDLKERIRKLTNRALDWGQFAPIPATESFSSTALLDLNLPGPSDVRDLNLPGPSALNAAEPRTAAEPLLAPRSPRAEPLLAPRDGNPRPLTAPLRLLSRIIHLTRTFFKTAPPTTSDPTAPSHLPAGPTQPPPVTPRPRPQNTAHALPTSPAFYLSSQLRTASPLQSPKPPTEVSNLNLALHMSTMDKLVLDNGVACLQEQLREAQDELAACKALHRSPAHNSGSVEASPNHSPAASPPPAAPVAAPAAGPVAAPPAMALPSVAGPSRAPAQPLARQPPAFTTQVNHRTLQSVLASLEKLTELHRGTQLLDWVERAEALLSVAFTIWDLNAENETLKHIPSKMSPTLFKSWALIPHDNRPSTFAALRAWLQLNNELLVVDHKGLQMSQLVAGKVAQGTDTVAAYAQKFLQAWTITGSTDTALQLCLFQKGLIYALQTQCVTDPAGRPWTDLPALIQFAGGREHTYFAKLDLQGDPKPPHRRPRYPTNNPPGLHAMDCSEPPLPATAPAPAPGLNAMHTPQKRSGAYQGEGPSSRPRKSWLDNHMPTWVAAVVAGQGHLQAANCTKGPRTNAEAVALGHAGYCVHCCIRPLNPAEHFRQKNCQCVPVPAELKAILNLP